MYPNAHRYFSTEYSPEQLNFFRMCFIVFDVVAKGLRIIFKMEWDIRFKETLGEWMDKPKNGLDFYSMESPRNLKRHAYMLATMRNGNTEEWNPSMLFYAILFSDSLGRVISAVVRRSVDDLRMLRNGVAHIAQAQVSEADFYSFWNRVIGAFHSLGLSTSPLIKVGFHFSSARREAEEFLAGKSCLSFHRAISLRQSIWRENVLF